MPRANITINQLLRTNQQLATANAGKAAAETAKVAEKTGELVNLTLGLDVGDIERRLTDLEAR